MGQSLYTTTKDLNLSSSYGHSQADPVIPSQTGHTGKFLKTDGSALSWQFDSGGGGGGTWGSITGTLSDQIDLKSALDGKAAAGHDHSGVSK